MLFLFKTKQNIYLKIYWLHFQFRLSR